MNPDVAGLCPRATAQVQQRARLMLEVANLAERNLEAELADEIVGLMAEAMYWKQL